MNGSAAHGSSPSSSLLHCKVDETLAAGFRRRDVVRLVTQCLNGLGYDAAASQLERDSGIPLLAEPVSRFRHGILEGEWDAVDGVIDTMNLHSDCRARVRFLVFRQKYLELLESGSTPEAIRCLREQLAPLQAQLAPPEQTGGAEAEAAPPSALQELSSLLMCGGVEELKARAVWEGTRGGSRQALLHDLQRHIPPSLLLPENRLLTLLQQAVLWQTNQSFDQQSFSAGAAACSLLEDFSCSPDVIPRETRHVLEKHSDEVWYVQFSHSGAWLASASKDNMVVVWDVAHPEPREVVVLVGHTGALAFVAWSPDDSHLLTCGNDRLLKLWHVGSGETFAKHTDNVTACAWLPDGRHFVSAGIDKHLYLWDGTTGAPIQSWHGPRVNDLAVSHSGQHIVAICAEKKIRMCEVGVDDGVPVMRTAQPEVIEEADSITSLSLSSDSRHLLVNTASEGIHAWDLRSKQLLQEYRGQKQGRFVIRSVFGGCNEAFVVSGSEDSQIYIWHRHNATLLEVLPGHSGTVNAVAWNPRDPRPSTLRRYMLASASDDQTVRVWGVPPGAASRGLLAR